MKIHVHWYYCIPLVQEFLTHAMQSGSESDRKKQLCLFQADMGLSDITSGVISLVQQRTLKISGDI